MVDRPILLNAPSNPAGDRRLLLFAAHFPPGDSTGALRWQKLATFAEERGWTIDVLTRHPDDLTSTDARRLTELPNSVRVFGVRTGPLKWPLWEERLTQPLRVLRRTMKKGHGAPTATPIQAKPIVDLIWREDMRSRPGAAVLLRRYRAWRYFEDEAAWARAARRASEQLADGYHAVASCGPPHMVHTAAQDAARRRRIPFLMDLRDPWSLTPALPSAMAVPSWYRRAEQHESAAVRAASLVVANTGALAAAMKAKYPHAAARIMTVMNGCDEELFPSQEKRSFIVCYAGNIYIDRDPSLLFRAFAEFVKREQVTPADAGIELIGHVEKFGGASVAAIADSAGVGPYVRTLPRMPRAEALKTMGRAAVLLSLPQEVHLAVPSKLFEYMQHHAWVVALATHGSATEMLLRDSRAVVVEPDDAAGLADALCRMWREFKKGNLPIPVNSDGRYNRDRQAKLLFDALDRVCGTAQPEPEETYAT